MKGKPTLIVWMNGGSAMPENQGRAKPLVSQQSDRRGQIRQVALLRVALLHAGGASDICVVKNVSPNGLSARVYRKLAPGEQVELEFRSGELLAGSVIWEREGDVGIVFPERIDVTAVLASHTVMEATKRRALPRISVQCTGQLSTGLRSMDIVLRDISQGGASLETKTQMTNLGKVRLSLPDLPPIAGVVRWISGSTVGVSFNQYIAFEQLARWIQARREGLGRSAREHGRKQAIALNS
jgi:hypothetical protein